MEQVLPSPPPFFFPFLGGSSCVSGGCLQSGSYTPLTRLVHVSYTSLTRLLHASYTSLTRLLHASYTPRSRSIGAGDACKRRVRAYRAYRASYTPLTRLALAL
jgi:hypothetical protein